MLTARALLELEPLSDGRYRSCHNLDNGTGAIFGGHMLGLALAAAQQEAPLWPAHSISGYFLRAGQVDVPVELAVERVNEGRRFASCRVLARQAGRPVFDLLASFHDPEPGVRHEPTRAAAVPDPETLPTLAAFAEANRHRIAPNVIKHYVRPFPVEMRLIEAEDCLFSPSPSPRRNFWFRVPTASDIDAPKAHQCLLAVMSDFWLPSGGGALQQAAGRQGPTMLLSLNHNLWFHRPVRVDSWLLYQTETVWAGDGRALAQGEVFTREGVLVASARQEYLMRPV